LGTTLSFLPWLNSDLETAFSRRLRVLLSSSYFIVLTTQAPGFIPPINRKVESYLSRGNDELNLTTVSAHKSSELLADTTEQTETVVLSKGSEEVLEDIALVGTGNLLQLCDDGLLVRDGQGRGGEDASELGVGLEGGTEIDEGLGGSVEGGGLGRRSVL
jgi:hypothetical protein